MMEEDGEVEKEKRGEGSGGEEIKAGGRGG